MTTKIKNNIKMEVTLEQSHKIQRICFDNGVEWITSGKELQDYTLIYISNDNFLYRSTTGIIFYNLEFKQIDPKLFIRTNGTCVEEETKNKEDEESEMVTEEKVYKNAKEYLVDKGLYEKVIHNYFNEDDKTFGDRFSSIFTWSETKEGYTYWYDIDRVLRELDINYKIDEILEDIALKEASYTSYLTEEKVYKNAKEYLVDICVYEKVIHNCLNVTPGVPKLKDMNTFSSLFTWDETVEGKDFWNDINDEIEDLELWTKIDEILEDVIKIIIKASKSNILKLKPEDIPFLMEGLEPVDEEGVKEQPKQYLVYVEGKQAPKKVHNSLKSAQKEANRLAKREVGYVTYVVEIVNRYIATVSVEEIK